jgi:hypothetical protein
MVRFVPLLRYLLVHIEFRAERPKNGSGPFENDKCTSADNRTTIPPSSSLYPSHYTDGAIPEWVFCLFLEHGGVTGCPGGWKHSVRKKLLRSEQENKHSFL